MEYHYNGRVYVRPLGRGIRLIDGPRDYLEDTMEEGYWTIDITARKLEGKEVEEARKRLNEGTTQA